jgi:hypothetical protein
MDLIIAYAFSQVSQTVNRLVNSQPASQTANRPVNLITGYPFAQDDREEPTEGGGAVVPRGLCPLTPRLLHRSAEAGNYLIH